MSKPNILTLIFFFISLSLFFYVLFNVEARNSIKKTIVEKSEQLGNVLSKTDTNASFDEFNKLIDIIKKEKGTYSLYIKDLSTNKIYTYNQDTKYYAASLYKLPVGVAVLKSIQDGNLSLDTSLPYLNKHYTDGTGSINLSSFGTNYTVDQLLNALYKDSDNVAQNILLDHLDVDSKNISDSFPNSGKSDFYYINESSAKELGEYIEYIFTSDYISESNKQYLLEVMNNTSFDYLFADTIDIPFSHKIGIYGGIIHDCGITKDRSLVICIMSNNTDSTTFMKVSKYVSEFISLF